MATYLVTGGAGFIGTNLVKQLLAEGHAVKVLDNYAGGKKPERLQAGAEYFEGDIRDRAILDKILPGVDGIFHEAALPRVTFSVEFPAETHDVNVNGLLQVLLAARDHKVKRLVFASSSSTYGDLPPEAFPVTEDVLVKKPIAPYALHKFIGEQYCRIFSSLYGLETVSLIYFNVYGPFADPNGAYALVVGKFLQQRKDNKPLSICGDGEYWRDYTHVSDVVRANILAMQSDKVGHGETINIGNNNPYSVNQVAELIGGPTEFVPPRLGDMRFTKANIARAKELLGWEPTIGLPEGIAALKKEWGVA